MVKTKATNPGAIQGTERYPTMGQKPVVSTPKVANPYIDMLMNATPQTVPSPNDRSNSQDLPIFNTSEGKVDTLVTHEQGDVSQGR